MVWTNVQTETFFTGNDQMAIPATTLVGLTNKGIDHVDDLKEFDNEDFTVHICEDHATSVANF